MTMDNGQRQHSAAMAQSCGAALSICPHLAGLLTMDNGGRGLSARKPAARLFGWCNG
jgi:hypothetical protein